MRTQLFLTPSDRGQVLSLEDFRNAAAEEGFHYEIIHGRLEVSPLPDFPHDRLRKWLERLLERYAARHTEVINEVCSPARVFLPVCEEVSAPEPDIAAYHDAPIHLPLAQRDWKDSSPLLVVEILSTDTADRDLKRNRKLYLQVPTIREYWIVDPRASPDTPSLLVYRRSGQRWARRITVPFRGEYATPLLPGFRLVGDPH